MSLYYHSRLSDQIPADLTRVLTPWNYLSVSPAPIKQPHTRFISSSDSARTLLDTPSPRLLALTPQGLSRTPVLLDSDTENFLQSTPFEKQFVVSISPAWLQPLQEVSPVVRASSSQEAVVSSPSEVSVSPASEQSHCPKAARASDHVIYSSDRDLDDDSEFDLDDDAEDVTDADADGEEEDLPSSSGERDNSFLRRLRVIPPASPVVLSPLHNNTVLLQSPCKILPAGLPSSPPKFWEPSPIDPTYISGETAYSFEDSTQHHVPEELVRVADEPVSHKSSPITPQQLHPTSPLSPLTPLTPLTPAPTTVSPHFLDFTIRRTTRSFSQKRRLIIESSSPSAMPAKRARPSTDSKSAVSSDATVASPSPPSTNIVSIPLYSTRDFPPPFVICPKFPLFYRRYPVSSYFQPPELSSPLSLFNLRDPGGTYNPPRSVFDLYTPRFVKGKGPGKLGLCPICIEPCDRGGENRKNWLAMKFSAFKCYHLQYAHGISAATGRPFVPPSAFRLVPRPNAGKKERSEVLHGKCEKCRKWVPVEGIKDVESKVKELVWWKHAASCYHDTPGEGDGWDHLEMDAVFAVVEKYHVQP